MNQIAFISIPCIHLMLCISFYLLNRNDRLNLPRQIMFIVWFVPVFGFLSALAVRSIYRNLKTGTRFNPADDMEEKRTAVRLPFMEEDVSSLVPVEEALLMNDAHTRRSILLEALKNPGEYTEILSLARFNHDTEITHYASTAIMEVQRNLELELNRCEKAYYQSPGNETVLDGYIDAVRNYLQNGFMEGIFLENQRERMEQLLEHKLATRPADKQILFEMLDNHISRGQFAKAWDAAVQLQTLWPQDQKVWLQTIRICVDSLDQLNLKKTLKRMDAENIRWTSEGMEQWDFYRKDYNSLREVTP